MKKFLSGLGMFAIAVAWLVVWTLLPWFAVVALAIVFALWLTLTRAGRRALSVTPRDAVRVPV